MSICQEKCPKEKVKHSLKVDSSSEQGSWKIKTSDKVNFLAKLNRTSKSWVAQLCNIFFNKNWQFLKATSEHLSTLWLLVVIQSYTSRLSSSSSELTKLCLHVSFFHSRTKLYQVEALVNEAEGVPPCLWIRKPRNLALILAELRRYDQQILQSVADNLYESLLGNWRLVIIKPLQHRWLVYYSRLLFKISMLNCLTQLFDNASKFFVFQSKLVN